MQSVWTFKEFNKRDEAFFVMRREKIKKQKKKKILIQIV